MRRAGWLAAVLVAAVLAGCGDDGDGDEAAFDEAEAEAIADAAVAAFVAELEAAGFTEAAEDDEDDSDTFELDSEECRGLDAAFAEDEELPGADVDADSGSYELVSDNPLEGAAYVEGAAGVLADPAAADEIFDLFEDERLPACIEEAFTAGIREGIEEDPETPPMELDLEVAPTETVDDIDRGVAFSISGGMSMVGLTFDIDGELHVVRRGSRAAMVVLFSIGGLDIGVGTRQLVETLLS